MKPFHKLFIMILFMMFFCRSFSQNTDTTNFYNSVKSFDLSTVLMADTIIAEDTENEAEKIKRPEILGFIGDEYQRFYIHFISVIQNPSNPYKYLVFGKTKVKETICSFQGTLTIRRAIVYKPVDMDSKKFEQYKQGIITSDLLFFEDKKQPGAGYIKGQLATHFLVDTQGLFRYDGIWFHSDGFSNNPFIGTWTSYRTGNSKKCHWGDFQIPDCCDLDIGAAEFSVNEKYLKRGWENYSKAYSHNPDNPEAKKARQKEEEQWWK